MYVCVYKGIYIHTHNIHIYMYIYTCVPVVRIFIGVCVCACGHISVCMHVRACVRAVSVWSRGYGYSYGKAIASKSTCICTDAVRVIIPCVGGTRVKPALDPLRRNVAAPCKDSLAFCDHNGLAAPLAVLPCAGVSSPHITTALLAPGVLVLGVLLLAIKGLAVLNMMQ